MPVFLCKVWR